ncbi:MAG: DEAD/DEAH box helicase, partial [Terriglobales bacterium]
MPSASRPLGWAHPIVEEWFVRRFGTPTEPQEQGWPHILAGRTTLISAPTGSGKTLSAFLACIDRLVRKALAGDLEDRTEVLYVSPLKALGNDIQKNLEVPLSEILQLAGERGLLMPEIRTAVRTGDTLAHERRAMLKRPPHILVTTPESLYILLTAEKSRQILRDVETVIVDEIHAVADDKRGAHLTLSLERLDALTNRRPVRIGLSATQKPIELIAHFLTGACSPPSRRERRVEETATKTLGDLGVSAVESFPAIVNIGHQRQMDTAVEVPASELGAVASNEMWDEIYSRLAELIQQHRSTLVFVNTRRMAERVAHHLAEILGEDAVAAHHGSLARKLRLAAEKKLKDGEVQVLVATASLELGIDIGFVDLVCHLGSPRSIAVLLQRIGRSGHWRGAVPKGRIFATTRDELLECAALVRSIRQGELDRIMIPDAPLDVLAQQIVASCAAEEWKEDELFALVRRAYPYRDLPREEFEAILVMLSEGIAARRGRYGAYLYRDRVNGRLRARRGARIAAITSGGAIPDNALYTVVAEPEGIVVGTVDEDFAVESMKGEIMLLGNTSWRIRRIEASGRMLVEDAHGAPPGIPFWRGEAPGRTAELSEQVAELRAGISERTRNLRPGFLDRTSSEMAAAGEWLRNQCGLDEAGAEQAIQYVVEGRAVLGEVPTQQTIIAERFFDEGGGMQLIIHAPFGARVNKAWGLALRKRFCRSFNFELQAAATDNGLNIALAEQHSFPLADVFHFLQPESVQAVLEQAALTGSPIFGTRWRWDAERALALLRFDHGKKVPPQIQRIRSDDLLASVFPDVAACQENIAGDIQIPDHPLVREVMKDVLTEAMDLDGLKQVLRGISSGGIRCLAVDTPVPSAFSHEILNANPYAYLDDAPLEERRARAVEMRRTLPESVLNEVGALDPEAIAEVRVDAWPEARDPDELHDVLQTLIALPQTVASQWNQHFQRLVAERRAATACHNGTIYWVAADRAKSFRSVFPQAQFESEPADIEAASPSADDARLAMVRGWMQH